MTSPGWIFEPQSREERQESLRKTLAESFAQEVFGIRAIDLGKAPSLSF